MSASMDAPDSPDPPKKPRKAPVFVKTRRQINDLETRALVWADYITCGAFMAAERWGLSRKTVYNIVYQCNEDPAFAVLCQQALERLRAELFNRMVDAQVAATVALAHELKKPGHSIPDLTTAVVQLSKVNGNHKGDQSAAAQSAGRGPSIALPVILTTPRLETDADTGEPDPHG